jgi:hypothetical protein
MARNVIGEHVLGFPREYAADRGIAFNRELAEPQDGRGWAVELAISDPARPRCKSIAAQRRCRRQTASRSQKSSSTRRGRACSRCAAAARSYNARAHR